MAVENILEAYNENRIKRESSESCTSSIFRNQNITLENFPGIITDPQDICYFTFDVNVLPNLEEYKVEYDTEEAEIEKAQFEELFSKTLESSNSLEANTLQL